MSKNGGHTPIKNFLLEAIIDGRLSQREMRILLALARATYGWVDKGKKGRRLDRASLSYSDLSEMTGIHLDHVKDAMRSLAVRNIVTAYSAGAGKRKGVYGIQSDVSLWSEMGAETAPVTMGAETAPNSGAKRAPITTTKEPPLQASIIASKPNSHKGLLSAQKAPKENIKENIKENPLPPKGAFGVSFCDGQEKLEPITTWRQALANQDITVEEALIHAERCYTTRFAVPFTPAERTNLATYFGVSPFKGTLLAFWFRAVPAADADRRERKREPEKRRYVAKSPFRDCHHRAAEMYADTVAAKERAQAGAAPVKVSEIPKKSPEREPRETSGRLLDLYFAKKEAN